MRTRYLLLGCLLSCIVMAGCELNPPPECLTGMKRCEHNEIMNSAIYSVCSEAGKWEVITTCTNCENNECADDIIELPCDEAGTTKCYDTNDASVEFVCREHRWIPTICPNNVYCNGTQCDTLDGSCTDGDKQCVWVNALDYAIEGHCIDNQWISVYCPQGSGCDGNQCEATPQAPKIPCDGEYGMACIQENLPEGWEKAECRKGFCEVIGCIDGYTLLYGTCTPSGECCGKTCDNCIQAGKFCSNADVELGKCINECPIYEVACRNVCINPSTSHEFCHANTDCTEFEQCPGDRICSGGTCICYQTTECENACFDLTVSLNHCGNCETDCTLLTGWANGYCENGLCQATACQEPYQPQTEIIDGNTITRCLISSSITACGDNKVDCTTTISGWINGECNDGQCIVTECLYGQHPYNSEGNSVCEPNDMDNCGEHSVPCQTLSVLNSTVVECSVDGTCEATDCEFGYHLFDGTCEKDDEINCGSHDNACTLTQVEGSTSVSCDTGQCLAVTCDDEHVFDGSICIDKSCTEGTEVCLNVGTTGTMYKCIDNTLTEQSICENNHSCNSAGTACGACINTSTRCTDSGTTGMKETCSEGEWGTLTPCTNNNSCDVDGTDCGICINGATSCTDSGNIGQITTCTNGTWGASDACTNNYSCQNTELCGVCQNNKVQCYESDKTQTCQNGVWGNTQSCTPPSHSSATCSDGICGYSCDSEYTDNGKQCCHNIENGSITKDNSTSTCNFTCDSTHCKSDTGCVSKQSDMNNCGSCGSVCNKTKVGNSAAVTCSGGSCIATDCESGFTLLDGRCESKNCTENETKCANDGKTGKLYKCEGNTWKVQSTCTNNNSCNSAGTDCGECINDTTECSNSGTTGQTRTCSSGAWSNYTNCTNNYSCNSTGTDCGNCVNNDTTCSNTGTTGYKQTCDKGAWGTANKCSNNYSCNSAGTDCGNCVNNDTTCSNTGTTGYKQTCDKGAWGTANKCTNSYSCNSAGTDCGVCINNNTTCSNTGTTGYERTCNNGAWGTENKCTNSYSCNDNSCGDCINGNKQCSGTSTQTCGSGQWGPTSACPVPSHGSATCSGGNCGISCDSGYCESGTNCVNKQTDMDNCGTCGNLCNTSKVSHSTNVTCSSGNCIATSCDTGYHVYDGTCEPNDNTNCGSHNNPCSTTLDHATATCSNSGICNISCDSGYTTNGSICCQTKSNVTVVQDSASSCSYQCATGYCDASFGSQPYYACSSNQTLTTGCGNSCTNCFSLLSGKDGFNGAECVSGSCRISSCKTGYTVSSDGQSCECSSTAISNGNVCCEVNSSVTLIHDAGSTCTYQCQPGYCDMSSGTTTLYSCLNSQTSAPACGDSCLNCFSVFGGMEGYQGGAKCENGICKITSCASGYKVSDDGLSCVKLDCTSGETKCDDAKIYTCSASNEWVYDHDCPNTKANAHAVCSGGACSYTCNGGYTSNGNVCCYTGSNPVYVTQNSSSTCSYTCPSHHANCDGDWSNGCEVTTVTESHCGACNHVCGSGTHCEGDHCAFSLSECSSCTEYCCPYTVMGTTYYECKSNTYTGCYGPL